MNNTLPDDVARCDGLFYAIEKSKVALQYECKTRLRRTAPRGEMVWVIKPPIMRADKCMYHIHPARGEN